ncbi:MAG: glycosyltransferase [Cyanobium sp.]|jgi:glycosyltransferase involved in cell wall biosynthesis
MARSGQMSTTLFVCHEGQRTGAPLLLLWLIRWLVAHTSIRPVVALMRDGPLREEFAGVCPTHTFTRPISEPWQRRLKRRLLGSPSNDPDSWLAKVVAEVNPDCLYLNTLVLGYCLHQLRIDRKTTKVISSVHEMEIGLLLSSSKADIQSQIAFSDLLTCEGSSVQENLVNNHGVDPGRCVVLPAYVPFERPEEMMQLTCDDATQPVIDQMAALREQGVFLFGFAGSAIDRKGFDLFPLLVNACAKRFAHTPFKAVWVGCPPGSLSFLKAERDLDLLGAREHALLLPGVSCGAAALRQLDVLSCLSREDPGPVVTVEAGAMAIPSVCFQHCGGIAKIASMGMSVSVNYLDIEAFADALFALSQDRPRLQALGKRFQDHVFNTCTLRTQGPLITELITAP